MGEWRGIPSAYEALRPLLLSIPYVTDVEWQDNPQEFTHDFRDFRRMYTPTRSLAHAQALHLGVEISLDPWIQLPEYIVKAGAKLTGGRPVISRTLRHTTKTFPWRQIIKMGDPVFVGVKSEHEAFEREFGPVEHFVTHHFLEIAAVIAASSVFVGNQCCQCWIASAMGHPLIQETMAHAPDSVVPRDNAAWIKGELSSEY